MCVCRPYAKAIANLLDPQGGLFHRVIANSASTDKDGMAVDQLKSFSRVRRSTAAPMQHTSRSQCIAPLAGPNGCYTYTETPENAMPPLQPEHQSTTSGCMQLPYEPTFSPNGRTSSACLPAATSCCSCSASESVHELSFMAAIKHRCTVPHADIVLQGRATSKGQSS